MRQDEEELTDKQKRFADEYLLDLNAKQAAIRAGYSEKTAKEQASRLLTNVNLKAYIAEKQKKLEEKTGLTVEWVIGELKNVYEKSMQAVPVIDHRGKPTGEYKFEANAANRSLELLGKHLGMFCTVKLEGGDKPLEINVNDAKTKLVERLARFVTRGKGRDTDSNTSI